VRTQLKNATTQLALSHVHAPLVLNEIATETALTSTSVLLVLIHVLRSPTCINDIDSFTCPCSAGYERDEAGTCIDIDECARKTDNCANTVEECVNSVGSFDCPCASGFERNIEGRCLDINECVKETDTCVGFTETCENTFGSFKCPKLAAFKMMIMQQAILGGL
jgi:hypothetical protein